MSTGTSTDILDRVKRLIPGRWFKWAAPYRDAVLGGLSDSAAFCYGLIGYARAQSRIFSAYGIWLDLIAYDFLGRFLIRNGSSDDVFRKIIKATILQERVTRAGMISAVTTLTGNAPTIFEPWNTFDTGAYSPARGTGTQYGQMGYGVGRGGYGSMNLPGQLFMKVIRGSNSGVPSVGGYANVASGYGVGRGEYVGPLIAQTGVTDAMIYDLITKTRPTGVIAWVRIGGTTVNNFQEFFPRFSNPNNSPLMAAIL